MPFVWLDVAVAVVGLLALGLVALKVFRQVRALGREVAAAGERISAQLSELQAATRQEPG
ncbi:MAG: hypothetical protein ACYCO3_15025 [Mycobacteriales bacterium]